LLHCPKTGTFAAAGKSVMVLLLRALEQPESSGPQFPCSSGGSDSQLVKTLKDIEKQIMILVFGIINRH
jgi:hypothetical protein